MPQEYNQNQMFETFNALQGVRQAGARRQAGNALASGNQAGAANILGAAGDLQSQRVIGQDMTREADAQRERDEAEVAERKSWMLNTTLALQQLPEDQVQDAWMTQLRPVMAQMGVPEADLLQIDAADKSPASLQAVVVALGGENPAPWANDRSGPGGSVIRPSRTGGYSEVYTPPIVPERPNIPAGYRMGASGNLEIDPGYLAGQRELAGVRRAPPRPRAGNSGVNGSARPGSGGEAAPPDARRPWERY